MTSMASVSSSSKCSSSGSNCNGGGDDYKLYNIDFYEDRIETTVTSTARIVDHWIHETYCAHGNKFIVGLDTEWHLLRAHRYQVAILQLCVGRRCLIFQFLHNHDHDDKTMNNNNNNNNCKMNRIRVPDSLVNFLGDERVTFVGKEVEQDAKLLLGDWGLRVACVGDVSHMAAAKYGDKSHKCKGLKTLTMEFLHKHMDKSKDVTLSRWDVHQLSHAQVQYASIDAFVSLLLGMLLFDEDLLTSMPES